MTAAANFLFQPDDVWMSTPEISKKLFVSKVLTEV
jgi:hypothetical protein